MLSRDNLKMTCLACHFWGLFGCSRLGPIWPQGTVLHVTSPYLLLPSTFNFWIVDAILTFEVNRFSHAHEDTAFSTATPLQLPSFLVKALGLLLECFMFISM